MSVLVVGMAQSAAHGFADRGLTCPCAHFAHGSMRKPPLTSILVRRPQATDRGFGTHPAVVVDHPHRGHFHSGRYTGHATFVGGRGEDPRDMGAVGRGRWLPVGAARLRRSGQTVRRQLREHGVGEFGVGGVDTRVQYTDDDVGATALVDVGGLGAHRAQVPLPVGEVLGGFGGNEPSG